MNPRVSNMHEWMTWFLDDLMPKADDPSAESSQPSGFLQLKVGTFDAEPGSVRVVSRNTVDEKVGLLISAVLAVSRESHLPVLMFVSEKDETLLTYQMVSIVGQIDRKRLDTAMLLDFEWPRLTTTVEFIRLLPIYVISSSALSLDIIEAEANRLSRTLGQLGMLVVDADGLTEPASAPFSELAKQRNTSILLFDAKL